jgi:tetratricopeptide (TPR) repeat protein
LSYERLDPADPTDALARAILARAASFAPGVPIPRPLLLASLKLPDDDADALLRADQAILRTVTLGLLEPAADGALRSHRLLARYVSVMVRDDDAPAAVEDAVADEAGVLNAAGFPAALVSLQPHLRAVTERALGGEDLMGARLATALGYHLRAAGDLAGARPYYERALAIRERALGLDHPQTAGSVNNLGFRLQAAGDLAGSRPYLERALAISEAALGPDHPTTRVIRGNLAGLPGR